MPETWRTAVVRSCCKPFPDHEHCCPPQHGAQGPQDTKRGSVQAPEPSPPALCAFNADFPQTARTAGRDLPEGTFGSYSAILKSIPFPRRDGEEQRSSPPQHEDACRKK